MKFSSFVASAIFLAGSASAHTIFQQLYVNGVSPGHTVGIRVPSYDGPITDVTSNDLICNGGINPYQLPVSTTIIPVPAGAQVTAEWHHTLTSAGTGDPADPIDPSHKGPLIAYLAPIANATQSSVTGLPWFKIYEDGLDSGTWAVDKLIANVGKVSFTIPSCVPAGQYLLRVEIIALHAASTYPGAQLYMECAQIQITGGGSASPATLNATGTDPGITYNLYNGQTTYTIPGPPVFSCSGSGSGTTVAPTTVPPTTTVAPTTTVPAPTTTAVGTVVEYGQCGGTGWTGGTVCVAPYTCKVSSAYYSQCL
ncbi:glycosyl hydrolase family 61-domain-containing protein [Pholiota molesta]|nr:glycosyl hydrolase family 61-domain-containing protein [Pholiota molesta]